MFNYKKEEKMKKIFMTLAAVCVAATMDAQVYIGGGIGLQSAKQNDNTNTTIKLMPEIGYNLNDSWALGIAFGYGENKTTVKVNNNDVTSKIKNYTINPYARYTFAKFDKVNLFVDGGLEYNYSDRNDNTVKELAIGLKPGVAVTLNEKFSFVAHAGFLGWNNYKSDNGGDAVNTFGFNLDGSDLSFGFYYNF